MICSSDKNKLLIVGTHANRLGKLLSQNISLIVNVCGDIKGESTSVKLLGVIENNNTTFKHHFYGYDDNPVLLKQL